MEWALDIALIVLLVATLFHALRLERALGMLKRDRAALEELVVSFNSSTRGAEQGIERLRSAADGAGRQISRQVDLAGRLKDDLVLLCQRGDQLADRLEHLVRSGRSIGLPPPDEMAASHFLNATRDVSHPERLPLVASELPDLAEPNPRLRSQAERDLLRALKLAR